jgi:hypothetical protein
MGLMLDLEINDASFVAATTHLDVVNTPRCRARQMRAMLEAIDARIKDRRGAGGTGGGVILGADLNTHTFARGNRLRTMKNTALILGSNRDNLARRLTDPARKERAITEFARFGYETAALNDKRATARSMVSNLDDSRWLPSVVRWWVNRRVGPGGLTLHLRLDWLAARGLRALRAGEVEDAGTGVMSVDPQTFDNLTHDGLPLSDHDPIVVDLGL